MAADLAGTVKGLPLAWGAWSKSAIKRALARTRQAQRRELGLAPCRCAQGCVCNADVASGNEEEARAAAPSHPGHTPQAAAAASTASGETSQPRPPPAPVSRFKATPPPPPKRPSTEAGRS